ncbi:hypothetical protein K432DRAFT_404511 [Lepidopterella palustris CBS 459.81]|uniref:Uncharacterized protein n=1 Tax=Lepidopterella palustris CBS 459.81 TaxID=1314670 RepID=A0A8E2EBF3_9PEZI|nr:hypothetical protein K432DRAFT_404511 [Lepidopterella palustris CBS 459.81]
MTTFEQELRPEEALDTVTDTLTVPERTIPDEKSDVELDPNAPEQGRKFGKGDTVHMTLIAGGVRTKGVFTIHSSQSQRSYWEYQLKDGKGYLYNNGAWVREKNLKLEKRRG